MGDPLACDEALKALRRYSLAEVGDGALSVHRLVQAVASVQVVLVLSAGLLVYLSLEKPAIYDSIATRSASLWLG